MEEVRHRLVSVSHQNFNWDHNLSVKKKKYFNDSTYVEKSKIKISFFSEAKKQDHNIKSKDTFKN